MVDSIESGTGLAPGADGSAVLLRAPNRLRLVLTGEMDLTACGALGGLVRDAIAASLPIEVDARQVTFMDSSVIVELARLARGAPRHLRFIQPPDLVRSLLEVTHLSESVDIVEDDPGFSSMQF